MASLEAMPRMTGIKIHKCQFECPACSTSVAMTIRGTWRVPLKATTCPICNTLMVEIGKGTQLPDPRGDQGGDLR